MSDRKGLASAPAAVSVGTEATLIIAANPNRLTALIQNLGSATVFVGRDATVTTANGIAIAANAALKDYEGVSAWYGIVASGTCDVRKIEIA